MTNVSKIVLTLIILAIVVGGGIYFWQNRNVQPPINTNQQQTQDWLSYQNKKYGFAVKYPRGWYEVSPFPELVSIGSDKPPYEDNYYGGMIGPSGTIIDFWIVTTNTSFQPGKEEISKENVTIDGVSGEKIVSQNYYELNQDNAKIEKVVEIFFERNNLKYYIRGNFPYKTTQEEHMKIFDQIISSFRFID